MNIEKHEKMFNAFAVSNLKLSAATNKNLCGSLSKRHFEQGNSSVCTISIEGQKELEELKNKALLLINLFASLTSVHILSSRSLKFAAVKVLKM